MKTVSGNFNGTGAGLYVCCGFIPDKVEVRNLEATTCLVAKWSRHYRAKLQVEGVLETQGVSSAVAIGAGIIPYRGGETLTAAMQSAANLVYGEGAYIGFDKKDYKGLDIAAGADPIDKFTFVTGVTGYFNGDVVGTYIGEGSEIVIDGKTYIIQAALSNSGGASAEVELDEAAPTGTVEYIGGMYDLAPIALGKLTPAGFYLYDTTLNGNDQIMTFEASLYDN